MIDYSGAYIPEETGWFYRMFLKYYGQVTSESFDIPLSYNVYLARPEHNLEIMDMGGKVFLNAKIFPTLGIKTVIVEEETRGYQPIYSLGSFEAVQYVPTYGGRRTVYENK